MLCETAFSLFVLQRSSDAPSHLPVGVLFSVLNHVTHYGSAHFSPLPFSTSVCWVICTKPIQVQTFLLRDTWWQTESALTSFYRGVIHTSWDSQSFSSVFINCLYCKGIVVR